MAEERSRSSGEKERKGQNVSRTAPVGDGDDDEQVKCGNGREKR